MKDELTRKHWLMIIALAGMSLCSVGLYLNSVGVFYSSVPAAIGVTRGTFAMHSTLSNAVMALVAFFVPKRINEGNFKKYVRFGIILAALSTVLMSFCNAMWQFFVLAVIRGIATAFYGFVVITMVINQWFLKNHGVITSCVIAFSGIAGVVFSPVFSKIITTVGWRQGFIAMAVVNIVMCLPALFGNIAFTPAAAGVMAYGYSEIKPEEKAAFEKEQPFSYASVEFIVIAIIASLAPFAYGINQHLSAYANDIGMAQASALMISFCMAGNMIAKVVVGYLNDHLGPVSAASIVLLANGISGVMLCISIPSEAFMYTASLLYGTEFAFTSVELGLIYRKIFGVKNYNKVYPATSLCSTISSFIILTLVGYMYDFTGSYKLSLVIGVISQIVTFILLIYSFKRNEQKNQIA